MMAKNFRDVELLKFSKVKYYTRGRLCRRCVFFDSFLRYVLWLNDTSYSKSA